MTTKRHPKKASRDWHPADVIAAIHKRGLTLRGLGKKHQVSHAAVTKALHERNLPSERRIADALGLEAKDIWPSRYNPDGTRTDLRKLTRRRGRVNGNARVAALT